MSISFYKISGIIEPKVFSRVDTCRQECLENEGPISEAPLLRMERKTGELFAYLYLNQNFERIVDRDEDESFWKVRSMTHLITSSHLYSATWFPTDLSECSDLFIQKIGNKTKIKGFIAPYLCEEDQINYGAEKSTPNFYHIHNIHSIIQSIQWVEEKVRPEVGRMLVYFLNDQQTSVLVITFFNLHTYVTAGWLKEVSKS